MQQLVYNSGADSLVLQRTISERYRFQRLHSSDRIGIHMLNVDVHGRVHVFVSQDRLEKSLT